MLKTRFRTGTINVVGFNEGKLGLVVINNVMGWIDWSPLWKPRSGTSINNVIRWAYEAPKWKTKLGTGPNNVI